VLEGTVDADEEEELEGVGADEGTDVVAGLEGDNEEEEVVVGVSGLSALPSPSAPAGKGVQSPSSGLSSVLGVWSPQSLGHTAGPGAV
jgi:hypothetical protein